LRAIRLLKAFSEARPELSLPELAAAAGLKKSTAFRLLTALESEGLVSRGAQSETYRLGPEALALAGRALRSSDLRRAAHPELEALVARTGETASLEILIERETLVLDEVSGEHRVGVAGPPGTRWPAHATSTGKALLACLSPERLEALLSQPLAACTPYTITAPSLLKAALEETRRQGYASAVEELEAGYVAVAAVVRDLTGAAVAAVSVGGPLGRLAPERLPELAEEVKSCAGRIAYQLGYR
jgi:DNA-binding IclR family transcriptional regulator